MNPKFWFGVLVVYGMGVMAFLWLSVIRYPPPADPVKPVPWCADVAYARYPRDAVQMAEYHLMLMQDPKGWHCRVD